MFCSQGVIQNLHGDTVVSSVDQSAQVDGQANVQHIPGGQVASQEVIKQLGTNGGGFFNVNSAHPFESPNGLTNLLQIYLLLLIPLGAAMSTVLGVSMIPVSLGISLFIMILEVLVAFIQAYIFTLLTSIFIGMYAHPAH